MDKRYSIGQICELLEIKSNTLRYMEDVLSLKIQRDDYSNRYYTETDLGMLKEVKNLRDQGFKYEAIKSKLCKELQPKDIYDTNESTLISFNPNIENIEKLKDLFQGMLVKSINEVIEDKTEILVEELKSIKDQQDEIIKTNIELRESLERQQEKHFQELDIKLRAIMDKKKKKRNFFNSIFPKKKEG